jgi:hypothetical protein
MFKLAAVIRNHWVVFPHIETKTLSSRSTRQMLAPIARDAGNFFALSRRRSCQSINDSL